MLVLALQFSRGLASAPERTTARSGQGFDGTRQWRRSSATDGIFRSTAGEPLLQNGRENFEIRTRVTTSGELNLNRTWLSRTDRQCTN
jgi:hypothetical protein